MEDGGCGLVLSTSLVALPMPVADTWRSSAGGLASVAGPTGSSTAKNFIPHSFAVNTISKKKKTQSRWVSLTRGPSTSLYQLYSLAVWSMLVGT